MVRIVVESLSRSWRKNAGWELETGHEGEGKEKQVCFVVLQIQAMSITSHKPELEPKRNVTPYETLFYLTFSWYNITGLGNNSCQFRLTTHLGYSSLSSYVCVLNNFRVQREELEKGGGLWGHYSG